MRRLTRRALAGLVLAMPAADALAQSMGPITTLPWGGRQRSKPNPTDSTIEADSQPLQGPAAPKPSEAAPEPGKPKADR